jgi:hypothetical protein
LANQLISQDISLKAKLSKNCQKMTEIASKNHKVGV